MSAEVEAAIAQFVAPLQSAGQGLRWVRPANLHLTVRFLGDAIEGHRLSLLGPSLERISEQTAPFVIHARGIGGFPNIDRPQIIWVGLLGEPLIRLAQQVDSAAVQAGFAAERRPYSPHLTIGRVRNLHQWPHIRRQLVESPAQDFGAAPVSEMILYRSILGGEASQYVPLARYQLSGGSSAS